MRDRTFDDALFEHLAALQARDIERFGATLGDDVTVVDGRGELNRGRASVLQAHAEWFASADRWIFDYTLLWRRNFGGAGLAVIGVTYRQTPAAPAARFVLSLVFERGDDGHWSFVYDQNTTLAGSRD
jgi:ketosteroid isomerase-like protein